MSEVKRYYKSKYSKEYEDNYDEIFNKKEQDEVVKCCNTCKHQSKCSHDCEGEEWEEIE